MLLLPKKATGGKEKPEQHTAAFLGLAHPPRKRMTSVVGKTEK